MKKKDVGKDVGVWIDHRKAVIVAAGDAGVDVQRIPSNMEKHVRFSGAPRRSRPRTFETDGTRTISTNTMRRSHARIREAESILLLGPGEAKIELKHHLEREGLGGRIVGVDTVDKIDRSPDRGERSGM